MRFSDIAGWVPKRRHHVARDTWEKQYRSGYWDYLRGVGELAHYSVIVGYCRHFKPGGAILDVGCGEGILQRALTPHYSKYLGIDLSEAAVRRAMAREHTATRFQQADASRFDPGERFDVVIFNECLSYFERPLQITRRYEPHLESDGLFIVSNVVRRRTRMARRQLESAYRVLDRVTVENAAGIRWDLMVLGSARA